jgi:ABC-type sugar transport system permease subunit
MPGWLLPWVVPLVVVAVVVLFATSTTVATIALVVFVVVCLLGLARMRVQYLKDPPPDPELVRKPFWRF